jgi:hypothetical protein
MPKSKIILAIGFVIALLPLLGFPHGWESFFEVVGGLSIVLLSVLISVDRRLSLKAKMHKRQARKRVLTNVEAENTSSNMTPSSDDLPL